MRKEKQRKDRLPVNRSKLQTGSLIAALIAAVALFAAMLRVERGMLMGYEKGTILIAKQEIPRGQLLTMQNAEEYFVGMELDKNCIPETALTDMAAVQDMVAAADIEKGVLLTRGMFEQLEDVTRTMKEPVIAGCKAEDLYQIVGGVLRAGDRIHIYAVSEEGGTHLIWQDVFVQQVFDASGSVIAGGDPAAATQRINIFLEKEDVERFYSELAEGSLRVVKVCD